MRYGKNDAPPTVMAKGHDELALAIRREARKHVLPMPEKYFLAVARILAFVYRLEGES